MEFIKEQLSDAICKHTEKENGLGRVNEQMQHEVKLQQKLKNWSLDFYTCCHAPACRLSDTPPAAERRVGY